MNISDYIKKFELNLTEQQISAVESVDTPTLLLAVPGSGKTTVLIARLGYMIHALGIDPGSILTITYTVAATEDMKSRYRDIFGQSPEGIPEFRTINGICAKIINYYGSALGKVPFELITSEGEKLAILRDIYREHTQEYPTESELSALSTQVTYIKNMMLSDEEIRKLSDGEDFPLKDIYFSYCEHLRSIQKMDYDDQMVYTLTMLKKNHELLTYFQNKYEHILVDEAQDTSKIQHMIIKLLASRHENLFMVGDEDQSIYGFRAAYPDALLNFEKDHPGANVLIINTNFRSVESIVTPAENFIKENKFRYEKNMVAAREKGKAIKEIKVKSRSAQYNYLKKVAADCKVDTAVLYRDNECILPLIDILEREGIDYRIRNQNSAFFQNRVVVDIKNIILFSKDPYDTELFMNIYYKIGTYMNRLTALDACKVSQEKGIPILDAAAEFCNLSVGAKKGVHTVSVKLEGLHEMSATKALAHIGKQLNYEKYMERLHISQGKMDILKSIAEREDNALSFVERLNTLSEIVQTKKASPECKLTLSTIHSSKGLEFDTVYILDAMDGILPEEVVYNRKKATNEQLKTYEEERRLYYVGITRAINRLVIFSFSGKSAFTRQLLGGEITDTILSPKSSYKKYGLDLIQKKTTSSATVSDEDYEKKLAEILETGKVVHKTFGEGVLRSQDGDTLEIEFKAKTAKVKLKFMMERGLIE